MQSPRLNNHGQALIESVLSLPLIVAAVGCFLMLSYRGALFYFADYQAHEALICLDDESSHVCKSRFEKSFQKMIYFNTHYKVSLSRGSRSGTATVEVQLKPPMKIEKTVRFPLSKNL